MSDVKQNPCSCGRSPTGFCVGLHALTNEEYKRHLELHLELKQKSLNEQTKPQLLID